MKEKLNTKTKEKILSQVIEVVPRRSVLDDLLLKLSSSRNSFELKEFQRLEAKPTRHKENHNQRWI